MLVLFGGGLAAFGVLFLFSPSTLTRLGDVGLPTAIATQEIRGVYGGGFVGTGAFFVYCARSLLRPGLIALAFVAGGFVVGRTVGLIVDGMPNALIAFLYATEIGATIVALAALRSPATR